MPRETFSAQVASVFLCFTLVICHLIWLTTFNLAFQRASRAWLFIHDDNEAVVYMIMKGRSPDVRLVSRTHRVAPY